MIRQTADRLALGNGLVRVVCEAGQLRSIDDLRTGRALLSWRPGRPA